MVNIMLIHGFNDIQYNLYKLNKFFRSFFSLKSVYSYIYILNS